MSSAQAHTEVIDQYIVGEVAEGRMFGPFLQGAVSSLHINRMGVIPKGHTPGKWRLIMDLSFPEGGSVNDGIDSQLCSIHYTSVARVAAAAQRLGKGATVGKAGYKGSLQACAGVDRHYWVLYGREGTMRTACYPFGYAQPQSSSQLWLIHWSGLCGSGE